MDVSTLISDLHFEQTRTFQAPINRVFDCLWATPGGKVLEVMQITGQARTIGHQQQVRVAFGGVDLLLIETVTALTRPTFLRVVQQPDGLMRHDPAERDVPFLHSMVTDLDTAFTAQFGSDPMATQIDFTLEEDGAQTHVKVEVIGLTDQRFGWFHKRAWRKRVAKDVTDINDNIAFRLQVQ